MANEIRLPVEANAKCFEALWRCEPDQILETLADQTDCDEVRLLRITALYLKRQWQEALEAPLPEAMGLAEALGIHARCYVGLGDLSSMRISLNRAREVGMSRKELCDIYAQLLRACGRPGEADLLDAYGGGKQHALMHRIKHLVEEGRFDEALRMEGEVPEEDEMAVRIYRAAAFNALGEYQKADAQLEPLLNSEIELVADLARSAKAQLLCVRDEKESALELLKDKMILTQDVITRISLLLKLGRAEEAAELAQMVVESDPEANDRAALAECLLELGKGEEACRLMEKQDDMAPDSDAYFAYRYRQAVINLRAGGERRAKPLYDALLADCRMAWHEEPARWPLAMVQAACYRDMAQTQKAKELYAFLKALRPDDKRIDALGLKD